MKRPFAFTVLFLALNVNATPMSMKATLYNNKGDYVSLEPSWVEYSLCNVSQDTVWIERLRWGEGGTVSFRIFDEANGRVLEHRSVHKKYFVFPYDNVKAWKKSCTKLEPGGTLRGFCDVTQDYTQLLKCGRYRLECMVYESLLRCEEQENQAGKKIMPDYPPFWKGRIEVPMDLVIGVEKPKGEEMQAQEIFLDAYKDWSDKNRATALYSEIVRHYPHSAYSPKAQDYVIYLSRFVGSQKTSQKRVQEETKKLIRLYPDSPYCFSYQYTGIRVQK